MLEDAKEDIICELSEATGRDVSSVDIEMLQEGSIIQVKTESGGIYLLEITYEDGERCVHFARYIHKDSQSYGKYYGKQKLESPVITLGKTLTHDNMITQPITKITLLSE